MAKQPLALIILDGWGLIQERRGNAVAQAHTPTMERLSREYPFTQLKASGEAVGLPHGQMGNSEVGHLNMGAGRVVYQELTRISLAIRNKEFCQNPVLKEIMAKAKGKTLHLMGLLSDGGVHSHLEHLFALLDMAKQEGLEKVFVHCFLDGRDVPPSNAMEYITPLEQKFKSVGVGVVATVMGRYFAMDRDNRWERVEKAYRVMVKGEGLQAKTAAQAVEEAYGRKETDEFVQPTVIVGESGAPVGTIQAGDSVIFYNFRPDRAREITRSIVDEDFKGFDRGVNHPKVNFVCMTQYDKTIAAPVAFMPQNLKNVLGEVLAQHKLKQLRIAETEKYAHVTFFFNGGVEAPFEGEERQLIPSPKVATYDLKPEMSAREVADAFLAELAKDEFDVFICNFANPDMVGHTGVMEATIKAVETVDECLGRVVPDIVGRGGTVLITADHGKAECMLDDEGNCITAHTVFDVPFILVSEKYKQAQLTTGGLENVAPTMLNILGIPKPQEMTGHSLIKEEVK
ncbi:MAG TPA: 2,3-bisphosphoglycerate-independent phosphoglycerate mutase [Bacillota bacterium]|nr:2,3-bisphosphoglycerate-independent phosphoglycerate mutase [Bacillota bacterium]